jgi:CMP-N-acetylneuraminic acid synthetase
MQFKKEILTDFNIVVHCNTEEKAKKLLEWADSEGVVWANGESFINNTRWEFHKEMSYYRLSRGTMGDIDHFRLSYAETIISYEDAIDICFSLIMNIKKRLGE